MSKINYALAPAGATHHYHGMWRKGGGVRWYSWHQGSWMLADALCEDDYEPIPGREQELNRLADTLHHWRFNPNAYVFLDNKGLFFITSKHDRTLPHKFSCQEWQQRRKERIEAGLIKENNDLADAVEIEDDLTWLAKNLGSWPTGNAVLVSVDDRKTMTFKPRMNDYYSMREWLQRRRELGLIDEPKEKEDEGTKEFDGWHDFNESQPCEELREYLVYVQRTEGDGYLAISVWHDGKWWKTSQMPMPFKVTHFMEVPKPPQIKTAEQIAAEKREAWCSLVAKKFFEAANGDVWNSKSFYAIYDALLSGELEAPKGIYET